MAKKHFIAIIFILLALVALVLTYISAARGLMFLENEIQNAKDKACEDIGYVSNQNLNRENYCIDKEGALHHIIIEDNSVGWNLKFTAKKIIIIN